MADETLLRKVQALSDLELAVLLCLMNREHCIIDTDPESQNDLVNELRLVASKVFGLTHSVVDCNAQTSLENFVNALFIGSSSPNQGGTTSASAHRSYCLLNPTLRPISRSPVATTPQAEERHIASVVIVRNLDQAPKQIQIQALELLRTTRIYTRTSVYSAPKTFLLIVVMDGGEGMRLTRPLNDHVFISHFHHADDGLPNLEGLNDDTDSISSVVRNKSLDEALDVSTSPVITPADLTTLSTSMSQVLISVEMTRYVRNIISFMRLHRAVKGGISPPATKHFDVLVKALALLQGLGFVTPAVVALTAKKIYRHRIQIVNPSDERSMQWGSTLSAVSAALEGVGPEEVIEDVLEVVDVPL